MEYRERSHYIANEPVCTNVYIAAFTTSLARIKLYSVLDQLQEKVLYYDTDSVIFKTTAEQSPHDPQLGDYLGDLTDELPSDRHIVEFVSTGPKSYCYRDNKGAVKMKFKGISKSLFNVRKVNFESMLKCVQNARFYIDGGEGPKNMIFKVDQWGRVSTCVQLKVFRMVYVKRYIGDNYVTYPFGYKRAEFVTV